jgi:Arc/MetJ-type ribon-helix-helix transcriptional regulator
MSETATDVNIGEYLVRRIDSRVKAGYAHSREELVKKDIVHYLEDLDLAKRRSELFMETSHSAELMHNAWKQPVPVDEALELLASVGRDLDVFYDLLMDQVLTTKI